MAASGILASMSVVLGAQTSEFDRAMANARRELSGLSKFGEKLKGAGEALSSYVSAPLGALAGLSVKLAGDMEKANVNFEVMLGSAEKATAVLTDLKDFAASTPFEFPEVQDAAKKLLAFNTPASELKTTLRQLGDIAAGVDAPIGEIAEIYGKARVQGRLFQEDINQLTGRGIPIIQELAKQFKVSEGGVRKLVETGKVGFPNIQRAFADLTKEGGKFSGLMEKQSQTLPGLISTAFDSIKGLATDFGTEIINAFDLKGVLRNLIGFVDNVRKSFSELDPSVKKIVLGLGAVAVAAGPLLLAAGSLLTILPGLSVAFTALTGPIGLAVAAIAAAAVLIVSNWDNIVSYFTTGEGGRVFSQLATSVKEVAGLLSDAFSPVVEAVAEALRGAGDEINFVRIGLDALTLPLRLLASTISSVLEQVLGLSRAFGAITRGDLQGTLDGLKRAGEGAILPFRTLLGLTKEVAKAPTNAGYSDYFAKLTNDALGALQPVKDVTAALATQAIVNTGGTILALTDDQIKALQKLQEELRQNQLRYKALGDQYDVVGNKQRILQSGIESLIAVGFAPLGRTVQGFVGQLLTIPKAVEQIETPLTGFLDKINAAAEKQQQKEFNPFGAVTAPKLPTTLPVAALDTSAFTASFQKLNDDTALYAGVFTDRMALFNTEIEQLFSDVGPQISGAMAGIANSIGEAAGSIIANGASVGDGLRIIFGGILQALAQFMGQFGQQLIAIGIGKLALDSLFKGPAGGPLAIAAGVGLVALAGIAKAVASNASKSVGSIANGGSATPIGGAPTPTTRTLEAQKLKIEIQMQPVTIRQDGPSLRGVLSVDKYRQVYE